MKISRASFLVTGLLGVFAAALPAFSQAQAETTPQRWIVIKADDVRGPNSKWDRFIEVSKEKGVKVSIGLIGDSSAKNADAYSAWLKKWTASGQVEFWNHGWDHKRWKDEASGKDKSEFGGSGYDHQKKALTQTQDAGTALLGKPFDTFGSPFNAMDADTAKALNEIPELKLIFCYPGHHTNKQLTGKTLLPMHLRGEHDGTGKPNFAKFKEDYAKKKLDGIKLSALQFHPLGFSEEGFKDYADMLDFLKKDGWGFLLPSEVLTQNVQQ